MKLLLSFLLLFNFTRSFTGAQSILKTLQKVFKMMFLTESKIKIKDEPTYSGIETQTKLEKKELEDIKKRLESDLNPLKINLRK